ncbi:heparinase II/III family protein [Nitratidesulfovibrio liaohensis]|uniref:Heparinase II/III family protein n=1 Tax=Nitratidesulfovibrio liaohensis TaxID=2604158 RepID=A0ABY9QZV3_9BACT|nr:heparinase II/III family protein [Nitratidesulfovibrio liaohensis]WMW65048.1 heparinase II/III family protein [Nitratidesulfovibrio liaohensis]
MLNLKLPLDDALAEVITIPFHDPLLSTAFPLSITSSDNISAQHEFSWCHTNIHWTKQDNQIGTIDVTAPARFTLHGYDAAVLAVTLPKTARIQMRLHYPKGLSVLCRWSSAFCGTGERMEAVIPLHRLFYPLARAPLSVHPLLRGVSFRILCTEPGAHTANLSWFGLRNNTATRALTKHKKRRNDTWEAWLLPEKQWPEIRFGHGLLFTADDLPQVRAKKNNHAWKKHFEHLESQATSYLQRIPERDYGVYLPNHDKRYIRADDQGKTPYHWEALTLAFVGLVNEDRHMITHALRYLMCMVHTRHWADSMEQRSPSSTWTQRAFIEEMTTVSVALLSDWLDFALPPHTKTLINHALWDRGISPIRRDLLQFDYMHQMNQGIAMNRGCIIGGLYLEKSWPRTQTHVDNAYAEMKNILQNYIQPDGGVAEGPGYFCQAATAALWAIIAYSRARGLDWESEAASFFRHTNAFVQTMASTEKCGTLIPHGDCRTTWFGGDVVPIMATLFPHSAFASMLAPCLESGSIYALTGTLAKSGGMIGMVYGPETPTQDTCTTPTLLVLPDSAKVSSFRKNGDLEVRIMLSGCPTKPSHSHRDIGSFTLEVNKKSLFIDRGMIEYWKTGANHLAKTNMHNAITPFISGDFPSQNTSLTAIPPNANGDNTSVEIFIDITACWENYMSNYTRTVTSTTPETINIIDSITFLKPEIAAFHLHSQLPMNPTSNGFVINLNNISCNVHCAWAEETSITTDNMSIDNKTTYHFIAISNTFTHHALNTIITITTLSEHTTHEAHTKHCV